MDKVITSTAPQYPVTAVLSEDQLKLTTKSGMASGTTNKTAQTRRPGRSVRSTNHAVPVPSTAQSAVTTTASRTVFQSKWSVRGRSMSDATVCTPTP
jgi:hypothetical protein